MDGIPPFLPRHLLSRQQHAIVGLCRQRPALDLNVWAVLIGQVLLAYQAEVPVSPCPGLFPAELMVVRDLHDSTVCVHIISPEEVKGTVDSKNRCPRLVVLEPGQVLAFVDGPGKEFDSVMVCSESHRIYETRAGSVGEGGAVPEVVWAYRIRGIKDANSLVQVGLTRMQSDPHGPAGSQALFQITDFEVGRAIWISTDECINRRDNRYSVYLWASVPLNATTDKSAAHRYHTRFDNVIDVKHFLTFGLVENRVETAAQLGQTGDFKVFIFKK